MSIFKKISLLLVAVVFVGQACTAGSSESSGIVGINEGDIAPPFTTTTIDGEELNLEDLQGTNVVIISFASWCPSCVLEARELVLVYEEFKGEDFVFLTVSIDPTDTDEAVREFIDEHDTPWLYALTEPSEKMIIDYRLTGFDITYVIDKDGVIRYKDKGISTQEVLQQALNAL